MLSSDLGHSAPGPLLSSSIGVIWDAQGGGFSPLRFRGCLVLVTRHDALLPTLLAFGGDSTLFP